MLDLQLGWRQLEQETRRDPFSSPQPLFFEANLPLLEHPRCLDMRQGPLALARCSPGREAWVRLYATLADWQPPPSPRPARRGRLWVRATFNDVWRQLDRRRFPAPLRAQLEPLARSRRGLPLLGCLSTRLAELYLSPVTRALADTGWDFQLDPHQGYSFWVDKVRHAEQALDQLIDLLEPLSLGLDFQRTFVLSRGRDAWQRWRQRWRREYLLYRLGLVRWEEVWSSHAYLYRRPPLASRLGWPAVQQALLRCLQDPGALAGDRALWLLYLARSGHKPQPALRRWLEACADELAPLARRCLD